jgi:hypothetical protein
VFVHDRQKSQTIRVSVATDGTQGNDHSGFFAGPTISADGKTVAFESRASTLVPGDTNGVADGFVHGPAIVPQCGVGDVTCDGVVNVNDLLAVINAWGPCPVPPATCPADVAPHPGGDGMVNVNDLLLVINNWG